MAEANKPTARDQARSFLIDENYYLAEIGCHRCDQLLGAISGDKPEAFLTELKAVLADKPLCKQCETFNKSIKKTEAAIEATYD